MTNTGVYHLIGPIAKGYPNILYQACLHINGIPRIWGHLLTQLTGMPTSSNQNLAINGEIFNSPILDYLISKYWLVQKLLLVTNNKLKGFGNHYNPSNVVVYQFHKKLVEAVKVVNDTIMMVRFNFKVSK